MEISLHNTPLTDVHVALGAKMTGFGGWNMPLQYESILAEWEHNRKSVSIFDCSHMGEFIIRGDAQACGLDKIVVQSIVDMPLHTCCKLQRKNNPAHTIKNGRFPIFIAEKGGRRRIYESHCEG